ncbi:MAG: cysteine methyltransferase [Firmicutes bacterium HGW-Firmicutes-3]|jgi:methylated-DNA-[protein]-cysteine S-methyltransferase|nr:MAG: cysteine methyltransferase [Firmicutes bacterium HGW-Firmicutes-3]
MNVNVAYYESPIGLIRIEEKDEKIVEVSFVEGTITPENDTHVLRQAKKQMAEYFEGNRKDFDLPMILEGTDFEKKVFMALTQIEYGKVASYKDIARNIGHDKAYRAIGGTNHKNKLAIMVPCHRVVGSDGKMTGYAAGIWRKTWLIDHEKKNSAD